MSLCTLGEYRQPSFNINLQCLIQIYLSLLLKFCIVQTPPYYAIYLPQKLKYIVVEGKEVPRAPICKAFVPGSLEVNSDVNDGE